MTNISSNPATPASIDYDHFVGPVDELVAAGVLDAAHAPGHPDCLHKTRVRWQAAGVRGFARRIGRNIHVWIVRANASGGASSVAAKSGVHDPLQAGCAWGEIIKGVPATYRPEALALLETRRQIARMKQGPSDDGAAFARFMRAATRRARRA